MAKAIPAGYQSVTPSLMFKDTQKALNFYKKAFGAKPMDIFKNMNGKGIMHATMKIGNSILMMGDEMPGNKSQSPETSGCSPVSLFIYAPNVDQFFKKAVAAGCKVFMPVSDMFWGDRAGTVIDPFGYSWMIATHKKDLSKKEIRKAAEKFFVEWEKNNKK